MKTRKSVLNWEDATEIITREGSRSQILIGRTDDGVSMWWHVPRSGHIEIIGGTGAGGTIFLRSLAVQVAYHGSCDVVVMDTYAREYDDFKKVPGIHIVTDWTEQLETLVGMARETRSRHQSGDAAPGMPMVLALDGADRFLSGVARHLGEDAARTARESVTDMLTLGTDTNAHVIARSHRPVKGFPRDQFGLTALSGLHPTVTHAAISQPLPIVRHSPGCWAIKTPAGWTPTVQVPYAAVGAPEVAEFVTSK